MTPTGTTRSTRKVLTIAAGLALAVAPAAAAVQAQDSLPASAGGGAFVADATVTPAPGVADSAAPTAAGTAESETLITPNGANGAATSERAPTALQPAAGSVPTDESGSTEARTVQRSCGAGADSHYVPSKGRDSQQCYDNEGKFRSNWKYTATEYTNNVSCGQENQLPNPLSVTDVNFYGTGGADGGYLGICSDGFTPVHGRVTASADADGSATVVADGDKDNPEETTQGWASATVSADGPEYRCGKAYDEGGRGTADAPTSADNADQCGP